VSASDTEKGKGSEDDEANKGHAQGHRIIDHVVEQRVSNLAQGLLTLGTMSGPLLVVVHLLPQAVLAGLFFVMGIQALLANGITLKILFLLRDRHLTPRNEPLLQLERRSAVWVFVALELVGFGATFAITQTKAAIGFPVFIMLYIPLRVWGMPRWFTNRELSILDAPTASPFTMESVGGNHGEVVEEEDDANGSGSGGGSHTDVEGRGEEDAAERGEMLRARRTSRGSKGSGRRPSLRRTSTEYERQLREGSANAEGAERRRSQMATYERYELDNMAKD